MQELEGRLDRIGWRADDGSWMILHLASPAGPSVAVGPDQVPPAQVGLTYRFGGRWTTHEQYGEQFRFDGFVPVVMPDKQGVTMYLRKLVDGVGPVTAERLWDSYGPDAVRVLREQPERVVADGHLTSATATRASVQLFAHAGTEATRLGLMGLLAGRGFQVSEIIALALAHWNVRAAEVIRANPFEMMLADFPSAGWKRCDRLYMDLGLPPDGLDRQAIAAEQAIKDARERHTWHLPEEVGQALARMIGEGADPLAAMREGARRGRLVIRREGADGKVLFLALADEAADEATLAEEVRRLMGWMATASSTPASPG